jgi:hypothetical protein
MARVGLVIHVGGERIEVGDGLPRITSPDKAKMNYQFAPDWVTAALEGIRESLVQARQAGVLTTGCRAVLEELLGTLLDTREDVVRCAAGLAVWEALGVPEMAPEAEFDGQTWRLVFPAKIPSPAQGIAP